MKTHRHKPIGQPRFGCSGFSLLELLTAISIITLLAAILLPAFSKAKYAAYRTTSRNNLKQLISAYLIYDHNHGYTIPHDRTSSNSAWASHFSRTESFGDKTLLAPRTQKPGSDGLGTTEKAWAFGNPAAAQPSAPTPTPAPAVVTIGQLNFQFVSGPPGGGGVGSAIITIDLQPGQPVYFLAMAENVCTDHHGLAVFQPTASPIWSLFDYVNQQPISAIPGLKMGLGGNGAWDFWQWKGPLATRLANVRISGIGSPATRSLSESGTFPMETYNPHTSPTGLDKATSMGQGRPVSGIAFPNGYDGWSEVNYIYMGVWLEAASAMSIRIAVAGDDVLSAFVGTPASAPTPPVPVVPMAPAALSQPIASSYSINAWAQEGNPRSLILGQGVFYTQAEQGNSNTPVFTEGIWADLVAQPDDPIPTHTEGTDSGLGRAYVDRYRDGKNNVSFMDGHVDGVKLNALWQLPWHRKWPLPAR